MLNGLESIFEYLGGKTKQIPCLDSVCTDTMPYCLTILALCTMQCRQREANKPVTAWGCRGGDMSSIAILNSYLTSIKVMPNRSGMEEKAHKSLILKTLISFKQDLFWASLFATITTNHYWSAAPHFLCFINFTIFPCLSVSKFLDVFISSVNSRCQLLNATIIILEV